MTTAGNRWHIDCFRCNTCGTLLDSDANLLLLGDGSLICNNCTYSCSACGNKIEDLAILTGDQAFCASCFKCRNCKRKIENLRYARTSQGIFCMACHESLMARRRKKSTKTTPSGRAPSANSNGSGPAVDKSLPALPPTASGSLAPDGSDSSMSPHSVTPTDRSPLQTTFKPHKDSAMHDPRRDAVLSGFEDHRGRLLHPNNLLKQALIKLPENMGRSTSNDDYRGSAVSSRPDGSRLSGEDVPVTFDPSPTAPPFLHGGSNAETRGESSKPGAEEYLKENFRDLVAGSSVARAGSRERNSPRSRMSPHVATQDTMRQPSFTETLDSFPRRGSPNLSGTPSPPPSVPHRLRSQRYTGSPDPSEQEKEGFKLQEAPRTRRSTSSKTTSKEFPTPGASSMSLANQTEGSPAQTTGVSVNLKSSDPHSAPQLPVQPNRKTSFKRYPLSDSSQTGTPSMDGPMPDGSAKKGANHIPRKQVPRFESESAGHGTRPSHSRKPSALAQSTMQDPSPPGDRNISTPMNVGGTQDAFELPPRSSSRPAPTTGWAAATSKDYQNDDFIAPREAPAPPQHHKASESLSSMQSDYFHSKMPQSPLPVHEGADDGSADEEREEGMEHPGLFRKVSQAVKHGRSHSDKIGASTSPKWHRGRNGSIDISSPIIPTPEAKEDGAILRTRLRLSQQRVAELETERSTLQERVNGTVEIRQVNSELRDKHKTMAFLDSQREIVVRELEIMTEQLTKAKEGDSPIDIGELKNDALRDFASSMQKLKDGVNEQIEDLMERKNTLGGEISQLIQMKDKGFQEYESLTTRNQQLTEMNNKLVQNIQDLYKQGRKHSDNAPPPQVREPAPNGLGIFNTGTSNQRAPQSPMDIRSALAIEAQAGSSSQLSGETEVTADAATAVAAPQVVNIRKTGRPNKFNWKKGSESMAKNVKKGFKGAFGSTGGSTTGLISAPVREEQFTESAPYGALPEREAPVMGEKPVNSRGALDPSGRQASQGWSFLAQKGTATIKGGVKEMREALVSNLPADGCECHSNLQILLPILWIC